MIATLIALLASALELFMVLLALLLVAVIPALVLTHRSVFGSMLPARTACVILVPVPPLDGDSR